MMIHNIKMSRIIPYSPRIPSFLPALKKNATSTSTNASQRQVDELYHRKNKRQSAKKKLEDSLVNNRENLFLYLLLINLAAQMNDLQLLLKAADGLIVISKDELLKKLILQNITHQKFIVRIKEEIERMNEQLQLQHQIYIKIIENWAEQNKDLHKDFQEIYLIPFFKKVPKWVKQAYERCNQLQAMKVKQYYREAYSMDINDIQFYESFGVFLEKQEPIEQVENYYVQITKKCPKHHEFSVKLGDLYRKRINLSRRTTEAINCYKVAEAALKEKNQYCLQLILKLGLTYFDNKDFSNAIIYFEECISRENDNTQAIYRLIVALIYKRQIQQALKKLPSFVASNPTKLQFFIGLRYYLFEWTLRLPQSVIEDIQYNFHSMLSQPTNLKTIFNLCIFFNTGLSKLKKSFSKTYNLLVQILKNTAQQKRDQVVKTLIHDCIDYCSCFNTSKFLISKKAQYMEMIQDWPNQIKTISFYQTFLNKAVDMLQFYEYLDSSCQNAQASKCLFDYLNEVEGFEQTQSLIGSIQCQNDLEDRNQDCELQDLKTARLNLFKLTDSINNGTIVLGEVPWSQGSTMQNTLQNSESRSELDESLKLKALQHRSLQVQNRLKMKEKTSLRKVLDSKVFSVKIEFEKRKTTISNLLKLKKQDEQLSKLVFKNHAYLIRYLYYRRNSFNNIARHYFNEEQLQRDQRQNNNHYIAFQLQVQRGDTPHLNSPDRSENDAIKLLWKMGKQQMLKWIICLVDGILELQEFGLFHADLAFRNTISVPSSNNPSDSVYKLIDFDYAFKVDIPAGQYYFTQQNHTRSIIKHQMLSNPQNDCKVLRYIFRSIPNQMFSPIKQLVLDYRRQQLHKSRDLQVLTGKIMQHLKQYSIYYHHLQFLSLIQSIFEQKENIKISEQKVKEIIQQAKKISYKTKAESKIGYQAFKNIIRQKFKSS